jgi:hypothetical protein
MPADCGPGASGRSLNYAGHRPTVRRPAPLRYCLHGPGERPSRASGLSGRLHCGASGSTNSTPLAGSASGLSGRLYRGAKAYGVI